MESLYWLILLAVLLVIEILTLGLTTIWFAGGALAATLVSIIGLSLPVQIVVFFIVSITLLVFTRPIAFRYINEHRSKTNYEGLIGKMIKITERVDNFNQTGTAVVNGQEWTVRSEQNGTILNPGDRATITTIAGVKLIVKPYSEED
ncbi:MAG: NfeD family protein [Velocimicrobium sp.]